MDVGVRQIVVAAAATDDDRVVERGATAIGAPARQVSRCGVCWSRVGKPCMGEQDAITCKPRVSIVKAIINHPFVIPPAQFLYRRTEDRPAVWVP